MRLRALLSCLVFLLFLSAVVSADDPEAGLLFSAPNPKYYLSVDFHGSWVGPAGDEKRQFQTSKVVLRDLASGATVPFEDADVVNPDASLGFYRDVWSPDGEFLALPLGRYGGFAICRAARAAACLKERSYDDSVAIRYQDRDLSTWHDFVGWDPAQVLRFRTELDGTPIEFRYDLGGRGLSTASARNAMLSARNGSGTLDINWGR